MVQHEMLTALLGATATGAFLSTAVTTLSVLPRDGKYVEAINRAKSIIALNAVYPKSMKPTDRHALNRHMDELLDFLLAKFNGRSLSPETMRMVLTPEANLTELNVRSMRRLTDNMVPVAVVRELTRNHRVRFEPTMLRNWDAFIERYRGALVPAGF